MRSSSIGPNLIRTGPGKEMPHSLSDRREEKKRYFLLPSSRVNQAIKAACGKIAVTRDLVRGILSFFRGRFSLGDNEMHVIKR